MKHWWPHVQGCICLGCGCSDLGTTACTKHTQPVTSNDDKHRGTSKNGHQLQVLHVCNLGPRQAVLLLLCILQLGGSHQKKYNATMRIKVSHRSRIRASGWRTLQLASGGSFLSTPVLATVQQMVTKSCSPMVRFGSLAHSSRRFCTKLLSGCDFLHSMKPRSGDRETSHQIGQ